MSETYLVVQCEYCSKEFERSVRHINKNKKRGTKNYCSKKHVYKAMVNKPAERLGKKQSLKTRRRISETRKRLGLAKGENNVMYGIRRYGKDSPHWKGGVNPGNIKERNTPRNKQFIQKILRRDGFICLNCSDNKGGNLEVDHIMPWGLCPELRYNPENVRTLCEPCHIKYGAKPHTNPKKWATSPINKPVFFSLQNE